MQKLLTSSETATRLGIKPNTLEVWRHKGKGPSFIKLGAGKQAPIRYDEEKVIAWLEQCIFSSTSDYTQSARLSARTGNCFTSEASI